MDSLLTLPWIAFNTIIDHLIDDIGLRKANLLRLVCRNVISLHLKQCTEIDR